MNKRQIMRKSKFIVLWILISSLSACANFPRIYSGKSVHGWVIDAKTKQPIKDVVVVEIWELYGHDSILQMEGDINGYVHIAETLTDKNGYYEFSDWGPKFTMNGRMDKWSPQLIFYKFGYDDVRHQNHVSGNLHPDNTVSEHSGEKVVLARNEGSPKEYEKAIGSLDDVLRLWSYRKGFECQWVNVPRFAAELIKLSNFFRENRVNNSFPRLTSFPEKKCGDRDQMLKDYLK